MYAWVWNGIRVRAKKIYAIKQWNSIGPMSSFSSKFHGDFIVLFYYSVVLRWFQFYLADRTQSVLSGSDSTSPRPVTCGVPQVSELGPILFSLYTVDIGKLITSFSLQHHSDCYADDTQLYGSCRPDDSLEGQNITVHRCNCRMDGIKPSEIKSYKDGIYVVLYLATTVPC